MIEQLVNFVIRPPRADYKPAEDLLESEFLLRGRKYQRNDLEVRNSRDYVLRCSHYLPQNIPEDMSLPCVIYCHGNSGCRADANEAAIILLPSNVTVFTLDFSGSGLSDGDYVSLGWNEMEDLKAVVTHLRGDKHVSRIGLWGRSMGAVTCLMYGAQDPSIAGMVVDSPFSNLFDLMMELVDVYKIRLPKFTVKVAVQYMRRVIQKKASFDIMDLDTVQAATKSFIPALFGHATEDIFIHPHHSDLLYKSYSGDKNIIKFEGDHNSPRPQFYYDSITIFFYNILRPPDEPVAPEVPETQYYDADGLDVDDEVDESILSEIMGASLLANGNHLPSTPHAGQTPESTEEAINQTRSRWQMSRTVVPVNTSNSQDDLSELLRSDLSTDRMEGSSSCSLVENGDHGNFRDDFARYHGSKDFNDSWGVQSFNGASRVSSGEMSPHTEDSFANFPSNPDDEERNGIHRWLWKPLRHLFMMWRSKKRSSRRGLLKWAKQVKEGNQEQQEKLEELEKQWRLEELEKQGKHEEPEKQGKLEELEKQGKHEELEKQGKLEELQKQGKPEELEKQGKPKELEKQGKHEELEKQEKREELEKQEKQAKT